MRTTWILAADSSRVRIFERSDRDDALAEIEDFANPQGRANNRELKSDADGRFAGAAQNGRAHTAPSYLDAVDHATVMFSKSISEYLDKARLERRYDSLYLIAPPKFLGLMRQSLSKEAQKLVLEEIAKDVSWFKGKELESYIKRLRH